MIKQYIKRPLYIDRIHPFVNKDVIKVLVGQRRVGKSYLLLQIIEELGALGFNREHIIGHKRSTYHRMWSLTTSLL